VKPVGIGFYVNCTLQILATYVFLYQRFFITVSNLEDPNSDATLSSISYYFGLSGFLLVLPTLSQLINENGFIKGISEVVKSLSTGGPMFFMFHIKTKAYFFNYSLFIGGAKYRATGRGFITKHDSFSLIYKVLINLIILITPITPKLINIYFCVFYSYIISRSNSHILSLSLFLNFDT